MAVVSRSGAHQGESSWHMRASSLMTSLWDQSCHAGGLGGRRGEVQEVHRSRQEGTGGLEGYELMMILCCWHYRMYRVLTDLSLEVQGMSGSLSALQRCYGISCGMMWHGLLMPCIRLHVIGAAACHGEALYA